MLESGEDDEARHFSVSAVLSVREGWAFELCEDLALFRMLYVLVFNAGSNNEGLYVLTLGSGDESDGDASIVLAWEDEEAAARYGALLEEQNMPLPTPSPLPLEEIKEICESSARVLTLAIVREGATLHPPTVNVERFAWSPGSGAEPESELELYSADELSDLRNRLEQLRGLD